MSAPNIRQRPLRVYSVEKLRGRILLENAKALESLQFEGAEGPALSDDILAGVNYFFRCVASREIVTGLPHTKCYSPHLKSQFHFVSQLSRNLPRKRQKIAGFCSLRKTWNV